MMISPGLPSVVWRALRSLICVPVFTPGKYQLCVVDNGTIKVLQHCSKPVYAL
jgi:hypothetical protein